MLKAFAVRDDCVDSEVLSREYKVTSLQVLDTYPEKEWKYLDRILFLQ